MSNVPGHILSESCQKPFENSMTTNYTPPSKSEAKVPWILLRSGAQESFRFKFEGIRVNLWIMSHLPTKGIAMSKNVGDYG